MEQLDCRQDECQSFKVLNLNEPGRSKNVIMFVVVQMSIGRPSDSSGLLFVALEMDSFDNQCNLSDLFGYAIKLMNVPTYESVIKIL